MVASVVECSSSESQVIGLEALIAYDIDFPEEDDGPIAPARIGAAAERVTTALEQLLATSTNGRTRAAWGIGRSRRSPQCRQVVALQRAARESRAIVTNIPGTTRDAIEAVIDTAGVPLRLVDTAGLREATDMWSDSVSR